MDASPTANDELLSSPVPAATEEEYEFIDNKQVEMAEEALAAKTPRTQETAAAPAPAPSAPPAAAPNEPKMMAAAPAAVPAAKAAVSGSWMRQAIPDPLRSLVYYERPVHSAAAIAAVVVVLALTLCNCNFTLLWLVAHTGRYVLMATLAVTLVFSLYKKIFSSAANAENPLTGVVRPRLNAALDKAAAYAPSRADVHRLADAVLDEVPVVLRRMERALYCQDLLLAVKTLLVLFALELLGCLFSGATLIVLAAVALFAVPIVYERHQAQIDRTVSQAVTTVGGIVDKGLAALPGRKKQE